VRLAAIAAAAGAFSGLFGVGGGTIIVPLLAAIAVIGAIAAAAHAAYGNVDVLKGLLIAAPAIAGVLAGTALQQRVPERAVASAFVGLLALGFAAGMAGGLVGVGGGVLFVPALVVFAHQSQHEAVATSLVAVVLVAVVGAWRQGDYGNLRLRDGLTIGLLSPLGVLAGVVVANAVPERALELSFAAVQLLFAWQLAGNAGLR
jgi:uncharacterized protein